VGDEREQASSDARLGREVAAQERRKLRARREAHEGLWFGFASFGVIGWSVAVPALIGIAVGVWLDHRHPSRFSWTLMLLGVGIAVGCVNAWHWVSREHRAIRDQEKEEKDE
jgi:ATP synthase protein I